MSARDRVCPIHTQYCEDGVCPWCESEPVCTWLPILPALETPDYATEMAWLEREIIRAFALPPSVLGDV